MELQASEPGSCPHCWIQKHKCIRDMITLQCRKCQKYRGDAQIALPKPSFYDAAAHREIFRALPKDSLSSLSTIVESPNRNDLYIQMKSSAGLNSPIYTFHIDDLFDTRNKIVISELDRMVHTHLTADLRGKDKISRVIRDAVLAGGYMHLLSSTVPIGQAGEQIRTTWDGIECDNGHPHYALHEHLQYLVLCRLRELVCAVLESIRFGDSNEYSALEAGNAYAAAVIMKQETTYFRRSLRNGALCLIGNLLPGLKTILLEWFAAIEEELDIRLGQACGAFPNWQDFTLGSKKSSRRKTETLTLSLALHQIFQADTGQSVIPPQFTSTGDGNSTLLSPVSSPELKALNTSCSTHVKTDQESSHVSYPLPALFGTRAETSVLMPCDVLSHWRLPSLRSTEEDPFFI